MTRSNSMRSLPGLVATSLAVAGSTTGFAQADKTEPPPIPLPAVTVLGTGLADPFQTGSSSATVHPGSLILPGGITAVRDLTAAAPNVAVFDANNDRTPRFSVRGLRENNFAAGEAAVGMYVDDVPYLDLSSRGLPLYDVSYLEFVRGPQGTLYGAGSPGGVINIQTQLPNDQCRGLAGFSYGKSLEARRSPTANNSLAAAGSERYCAW
jgi:outer membrane receptor protein involved in Fe transport